MWWWTIATLVTRESWPRHVSSFCSSCQRYHVMGVGGVQHYFLNRSTLAKTGQSFWCSSCIKDIYRGGGGGGRRDATMMAGPFLSRVTCALVLTKKPSDRGYQWYTPWSGGGGSRKARTWVQKTRKCVRSADLKICLSETNRRIKA